MGQTGSLFLWGIMHGLMLVIEKIIKSLISIPKNIILRALGILLTFHFVSFCWIFFRADSYSKALDIIFQIKNNFNLLHSLQVPSSYPNIILMIIIGYTLHMIPRKFESYLINFIEISPLYIKAFFLALICWIIVQVSGKDVVPFIYFQF